MELKVVKDLDKCKILWNKFSPNETLWELWEVVYSFYNPNIHEPFFIVSIEGKSETGLLPLWFDKKEDDYSLFGGEYPENRKFWFDVSKFNEFLGLAEKPVNMLEVNKKEYERIAETDKELASDFEQNGKKYFINLKKLDYNLENYLNTFNKKHRKNLRYDLKQLEKLNYLLISDKKEHFDDFVRLSIERFGKESDLDDPNFVNQMKRLIEYLAYKKMLHTISIEINKKIEGVELAALYKDIYYVLNGASNMKIKNLGKLLIMNHIKNAIKLKAKEIDFLSGKGGWKELWNCEEEEYYDY